MQARHLRTSDSDGVVGVGGCCVSGCCVGDEVADMDVEGCSVGHAVARGDEGDGEVASVGIGVGDGVDVGGSGGCGAVAEVPEEAVGVHGSSLRPAKSHGSSLRPAKSNRNINN